MGREEEIRQSSQDIRCLSYQKYSQILITDTCLKFSSETEKIRYYLIHIIRNEITPTSVQIS